MKKYNLCLVNPNDISHRGNCIIRDGSDFTDAELAICENALNRTTDNWIKVSVRLPESDGDYLVTLTNRTVTLLQFSEFVIGNWFHVYSERWTNDINPVTHWQPRPNASKY